tara:strand:+ start:2435 stop:2614 length:180 start_codon:yes stop_codon:yes gene_type:complete
MKFSSFLIILLGVNLTGISVGIVIGYYINQYYWVYLSVPILTIGSLLMMYGTLNRESSN